MNKLSIKNYKLLLTTHCLLLTFFLFTSHFSLLTFSAYAEDTITLENFLTLSDAIKIAIDNSTGVQVSEKQLKSAELDVTNSWAPLLPQVSVSANFAKQDPINPAPSSGDSLSRNPQFAAMLGTSSVNSFNSTLQATQVVFSGFRIIDGIKIANISVTLMKESLNQAKQDVALNVILAYFNALKAYKLVEVTQEALKQAESHLDVANKLLKAGTGIKLDVIRAQNQIVTVQQQLSQNRNNFYKAKISLNLVMGRNFDIPVTLNTCATIQDLDINEEKAIESALANRTELKQLQYKKEIDEVSGLIQSRATWPTIALSASYGIRDSAVTNGNLTDTQNMTYGVNMNWPIFDGLSAHAKSQKAQNSVVQDQLNLNQLRQSIGVEIKKTILDINEAKERIIMAQQGVTLAKEVLRMAEVRYEAGVGVSLDVIDAQVGLLQAEMNLVFADFDLNTSKAKFYRTLGVNL